MGAVSSCCSVEESEDRQVLKDGREQSGGKGKSGDSQKSGLKGRKSFHDDDDKKAKRAPSKSGSGIAHSKSRGSFVTKDEVDDLLKRLEGGMHILVLLQDGTRLACILHYNAADNALSISCEDKVRLIPLSDVKALLYTKEQLQRVETKANLIDDENCVALHLLESGNCIPLRFDSPKDKFCFVDLVKAIKV